MSESKILKLSNSNHPVIGADREKLIEAAAEKFGEFLDVLGHDWQNDHNASDTPRRVAKAIVNEICAGNFDQEPKITAFDNEKGYNGMVAQCNIEVVSLCAHHWLPFTGVAHVAYIPSKEGKMIGLSKLNRVVDWFARRPQIQEDLTIQIFQYLNVICKDNDGVAVTIESNHTCCSSRGIRHKSTMTTAEMNGRFREPGNLVRTEYLEAINRSKR